MPDHDVHELGDTTLENPKECTALLDTSKLACSISICRMLTGSADVTALHVP